MFNRNHQTDGLVFVLTVTLALVATRSQSQQIHHPSLPTPSYISAGFNLRSVLWNPTDGFGGGDNRRAMIYVKGGPDRTRRNVPLQVIVSSDVEHEFAYTDKSDSYMYELIHMDDGTELKGKYFDGEWVSRPDGTRYWGVDEVHSLVFDCGDFHVRIRAPKQRVAFRELLRIAGSFAHS